MIEVSLPVHPLSRAALLKHYGPEPICIPNHDVLFDQLAGTVRRHSGEDNSQLKSRITLMVDDDIARHIHLNAQRIGARLLRYHRNLMFWYAATVWRIKGFGHAQPALADWLALHEIDEDDYSVSTAYRAFTRWQKNIEQKNAAFFGQMRGKMNPEIVLKKQRRRRRKYNRFEHPMLLSEVSPECALARFMASVAVLFRRTPKCLEEQARVHLYITLLQCSFREAAQRLHIKPSTAHSRYRSMQGRLRRNPALQRLMEQARALPLPA